MSSKRAVSANMFDDGFDDDIDFSVFFPATQPSEPATIHQVIVNAVENQADKVESPPPPVPVPANDTGHDSWDDDLDFSAVLRYTGTPVAMPKPIANDNAGGSSSVKSLKPNPKIVAAKINQSAATSSRYTGTPVVMPKPIANNNAGGSSSVKSVKPNPKSDAAKINQFAATSSRYTGTPVVMPKPIADDNTSGLSSVKLVEPNPKIDAAKIQAIVNAGIPLERSDHSAIVNHSLLQAHKESIKAATVHTWAAAHGCSVEGAKALICQWDVNHRAAFESAIYAELNLAAGTPLYVLPPPSFSPASVPTNGASAPRKHHDSLSSDLSSSSTQKKKQRNRFTAKDRKLMLDAAESAFRANQTLTVKDVLHIDFADQLVHDHPNMKHPPASIAKHYERKLMKKLNKLRRKY
uniref:Rad4 domain-containing protein n=1 Tax=Panagrellus redivivus TaxID=6233 RepID=A0A7E4UUE4_PANRE